MNEITSKQLLLDKKGSLLNPGYATHMYYDYNRKCAKRPPFSLKEWDFYQIHFGHCVLQMTIGHVSYCADASATVIDLDTGVRQSVGDMKMFPNRKRKDMPLNPEVPNMVTVYKPKFHVKFETTEKERRLSLSSQDKYGVNAEINLILTNCGSNKDKMVIATPFDKPKRWYLNYKENCFVVNGMCNINGMSYEIRDGFGLLDWGRGVWPFHNSWVWGNGGTVVDGKHFGFNIGWGFGDTSAATENMFFYDNKAYKLGVVEEIKTGDNYRYVDKDKKFSFKVKTLYDNYTKRDVAFVHNECHQVFGLWKGYVVLDDGTKVEIPEFVAFCEHADNNW